MRAVENSLCVVCGSEGKSLYSDLPDSTYSAPGNWSLSRCRNPRCETVWICPSPTEAEIIGFYENYYTQSGSGTPVTGADGSSIGPAGLRWKAAAKAVLGRLLGNPVRLNSDLRYLHNKAPGRLLDVGCGNGAFLAEAAARGWHVYGQEFDGKAAAVASEVSGAEVRVGSLPDIGYNSDFFDAVTLSNVLEHLPNPLHIFQEIKRILRPGGLFVSISPNPNSYLHDKYKSDWRGLEVPRHLFLFPPQALRSMAEKTGFSKATVFSSLGQFDSMEQASLAIRHQHVSDASNDGKTSKHRKLALHAATVFGHDVGEWSVIVAEK